MKLYIKKLIAKEYIYLFITFLISLIGFLCTYAYNFYKRNQVEKLSHEIYINHQMVKSLPKQFDAKIESQKWFYSKFLEEFNMEDNNKDSLWHTFSQLAITDSINNRWKGRWQEILPFFHRIGFSDPDTLKRFITNNIITAQDSINKGQVLKIKSKNEKLIQNQKSCENQILNQKQQIQLGIDAFLICVFVVFVLRYIYYGLRWSSSILQQKVD